MVPNALGLIVQDFSSWNGSDSKYLRSIMASFSYRDLQWDLFHMQILASTDCRFLGNGFRRRADKGEVVSTMSSTEAGVIKILI